MPLARALQLLKIAGYPPDRSLALPETAVIYEAQPYGPNIPKRERKTNKRPPPPGPLPWSFNVCELKAKPSQWRLYFYVPPNTTKIIFLYAVAKKKWKADPGDVNRINTIIGHIKDGKTKFIEIDRPEI